METVKFEWSNTQPTISLQFTGNWFIDAGILGFVNLMEEIYGWNLEELQKRIEKEPEIVYYGYFPFAYLFYHSKVRDFYSKLYDKQTGYVTKIIERKNQIKKEKDFKKIEKLNKQINELNLKIKELKNKLEKEKKNLIKNLSGVVKYLCEGKIDVLKNKPIISDFSIKGQQFAKNFALFNPSRDNKFKKDLEKSYLYVYYLLREDIHKLKELKRGDKGRKDIEIKYEIRPNFVVNPFLVPDDSFPNILYTKPLTLDQIRKLIRKITPKIPLYLLILSFQNSFISFYRIRGRYLMFYTNNLKASYNINKRINTKIEKTKDEPQSLFRITLSSIIDELVEEKSKFSLENMYLIEYTGIGADQKLIGVEYIGIPKLQAGILLEDPIRESLNINLQIDDDNWKCILEEFIKNKPLHPLILMYIQYCINKNRMVNRKTSLYALAVDAKIKENNYIKLFSSDFFKGYKSIVNDIKETYRNLSIQATNISKLFDSKEDRQKTCYSLIATLKRRNKIAFTNILLKKFLEKSGLRETSYLNRFVFDKVIMNDVSWENYALALVVGIWGFGGGESGESDLGE